MTTQPESNIISKILKDNSLTVDEFAKILEISKSYLYRLEHEDRKPSLDLMEKLAKLSGVTTGMMVDAFDNVNGPEAANIFDGIRRHIDTLRKLRQERSKRLEVEQRNAVLESTVEHKDALLQLHLLQEDVLRKDLSRSERKKEIERLAKLVACIDEFSFEEMAKTFGVSLPLLKSWLKEEKKVFKCMRISDREVMATSPGEAALYLRCSDCKYLESNECDGYGDMKSPDNIITLIAQLETKGITRRDEQADVLKESYGMSNISAHQISEILYRNKVGKKVPEAAYFLEPSTAR
ncbi:helix-turn-helix domain-containing protein [Synergistaceae bacterium OttesenSCG-928-I11]|nr:helix-turn-helix domain-containing protein [Synergistaceae bacterium OttesenSCG-928-I11]